MATCIMKFKPTKLQSGILRIASLTILIALVVFALLVFNSTQNTTQPTSTEQTSTAPTTNNKTDGTPPNEAEPPTEVTKLRAATLNPETLQATIERFMANTESTISLAIYDLNGQQELAAFNADRAYFSASLYKLYLSFLTYQDIDKGLLDLKQEIIDHNDFGRLQLKDCLRFMISISDSPCAEAILAKHEYGAITERMRSLGTNIDAAAFTVSARDMNIVLKLIYEEGNLNSEHRELMFESLKTQLFSHILRRGFRNVGVIYNKTGDSQSRGIRNDVGILIFDEGRQALAISILSINSDWEELYEISRQIAQIIENSLDSA